MKDKFKIGISSIGAHLTDPITHNKLSDKDRVHQLINMGILADKLNLDIYALGESHEKNFVSAGHTVILAAIAQATNDIHLMSSVTVISPLDPIRVYEDFTTLDLISNGRSAIVLGKGSRVGSFELLGYSPSDYDELFEEKENLMLELNQSTREQKKINWQGKFRAPLMNAEIFPKPTNNEIMIWHAVGGGSRSAISAAKKALPIMLTTLAGSSVRFKHAIDAYRQTLQQYHDDLDLPIITTSWFYTAKTDEEAVKQFYPYFNGMMKELRSDSVPIDFLYESLDVENSLMIGSAETIINKLKYQYSLYQQQGFLAHVDTGAIPEKSIMNNIEVLAKEISPEIKRYVDDF